MSTKKKLSNQPKRLEPVKPQPIKSEQPTEEPTVEISKPIEIPAVETYKPSDNADKYPIKIQSEYTYKLLVWRNDYIALQEDVTKHMNDGWKLAGGVCTNIYSDGYSVTTVWCQAIHKEISNNK
jgi:hypothetical protein